MNSVVTRPAVEADPAFAAVAGAVALLLRAEASVVLIATVYAYYKIGGAWTFFATLFLVPDLSMLGYLFNRRVGAWVYNLGHTYLAPTVIGLIGLAFAVPDLYALALIWLAHIGFDRLIGYGLKYPIAFGATHLGWKGRRIGNER